MADVVVVASLKDAERIVAKNFALTWDGWDIVHTRPDKEAYRKQNGVFRKGKWFIKTIYSPDREGYKLPAWLVK